MSKNRAFHDPVVIIGAGPAGLAAGIECARQGLPSVILEMDDCVGGMCRTVTHGNYRFDLGGHRFFTKNSEVESLWHEMLGSEFMLRPRQSRIFFRGRFADYPLRPLSALSSLGPVETVAVIASYLANSLGSARPEESFEDWAINQFGRRLYQHFFKSYTEKVWGIPCSCISAEWGAQRIKGLNLASAIQSAFTPSGKNIKTLINEFEYPRLGAGQMYDRMAAWYKNNGGEIRLGQKAVGFVREDNCLKAVRSADTESTGRVTEVSASQVISSMPLTELIPLLPGVSVTGVEAAGRLGYRSLITVNLIIDSPQEIADTWIYIHDPGYRVGRVQCFANWSSDMVPDKDHSSLGFEFFSDIGDATWNSADSELVELAIAEGEKLGLLLSDRVRDGFVVRVPLAYPLQQVGYERDVSLLRNELFAFNNLQVIGRYGMFRYNNMDHSILTGLHAVRNILGGSLDLWDINADNEYHESSKLQGNE